MSKNNNKFFSQNLMIIPLKNTIPLSDRSTCIVSYDALLHSRRKLDDDLYPTNP